MTDTPTITALEDKMLQRLNAAIEKIGHAAPQANPDALAFQMALLNTASEITSRIYSRREQAAYAALQQEQTAAYIAAQRAYQVTVQPELPGFGDEGVVHHYGRPRVLVEDPADNG